MQKPLAVWLLSQLSRHWGVFFSPRLQTALSRLPIRFLPMGSAREVTEPSIVIPTDLNSSQMFSDAWTVSAYGAEFQVCHRTSMPPQPDWQAWPSVERPLWYVNSHGTRVPAWDLWGTLVNLMTLQHERESDQRDRHGRFVGTFDPRAANGLLEVPFFNIAAFVLAGEACRIESDSATVELGPDVNRPVLILSHDCDILEGNDRYTQAIRLLRVIKPLTRMRPPQVANLWWIVRNAVRPRDFYLDNCLGLMTLERTFGYTSTFYLLNGSGGRFGARSGSTLLENLVSQIADGWQLGMHYNYDTLLADGLFRSQQSELKRLIGESASVGRAHYLRFDPDQSFSFLGKNGIVLDESLGYPDLIGYRTGVAGAFRPYDEATGKEMRLTEVPMAVMENTLVRQYNEQSIAVFERLLHQLKAIGGALSVIVHPGAFYNPEFPALRHLYHKMLQAGRAVGAEGMAATELDQRMQAVDLTGMPIDRSRRNI